MGEEEGQHWDEAWKDSLVIAGSNRRPYREGKQWLNTWPGEMTCRTKHWETWARRKVDVASFIIPSSVAKSACRHFSGPSQCMVGGVGPLWVTTVLTGALYILASLVCCGTNFDKPGINVHGRWVIDATDGDRRQTISDVVDGRIGRHTVTRSLKPWMYKL